MKLHNISIHHPLLLNANATCSPVVTRLVVERENEINTFPQMEIEPTTQTQQLNAVP